MAKKLLVNFFLLPINVESILRCSPPFVTLEIWKEKKRGMCKPVFGRYVHSNIQIGYVYYKFFNLYMGYEYSNVLGMDMLSG